MGTRGHCLRALLLSNGQLSKQRNTQTRDCDMYECHFARDQSDCCIQRRVMGLGIRDEGVSGSATGGEVGSLRSFQ